MIFMSLEMYAEQILEHYKSPHNFGEIKNAQVHARDLNPLCGDEIEIFAKLNSGKISEIKFRGAGCAISQASASLLTDFVKGKSFQEIMKMGEIEILKILGIDVSPARKKCALLGLWVLQFGIRKFLEGKKF